MVAGPQYRFLLGLTLMASPSKERNAGSTLDGDQVLTADERTIYLICNNAPECAQEMIHQEYQITHQLRLNFILAIIHTVYSLLKP